MAGTLLGPEGLVCALRGGAALVGGGAAGCGWLLGVCGSGGASLTGVAAGVRPFFENCTVDASIFVAKLVRAHGGCLGTRSR